MIEKDVQIGTASGTMPAFTVRPDGDGPWAPVIFLMDAPGFREELKNMARRIAREGYFCLLPDLYYRLGTVRMVLDRNDDSVMKVMHAVRSTVTNAKVVSDMGGMLNFLDAQADVKPGPVGTVGHCMSGSYVVATAAAFPSRIKAAAAFYGTRIVTDEPDSPHHDAHKIKAEVYLCFAETDSYVPDTVPPAITEVFVANDVAHTVEVKPGTEHGFCFAERPAYHPEAAEAGFQKMSAMFGRTLR